MLRAWLITGLASAAQAFSPAVQPSSALCASRHGLSNKQLHSFVSLRAPGAESSKLRNSAQALESSRAGLVGIRPTKEVLAEFDSSYDPSFDLRTAEGRALAEAARLESKQTKDQQQGVEQQAYGLLVKSLSQLASDNQLQQYDENGDGFDFDEFAAAFGSFSSPSGLGRYANVTQLRRLYDEIDLDKGGRITVDELIEWMEANGIQ